MLAEKREDVSVKHLMEGNAIEAWGIGADVWIALRLPGCAWRKEGEMTGVGNEMVFCASRQSP